MQLRLPARLAVEQLEDRLTPSWSALPPSLISLTGAIPITLSASGDAMGNGAITANEADRYYFDAVTSGVYRFAALTPSSSLNPVLGVFDSAGKQLAFNNDISSTNKDSQVTISLLGGRRYYFGVSNLTGTTGGSYNWSVEGPEKLKDDPYEDNDTRSQAIDLGTPSAARTFYSLKLLDSSDYFRFRLSAPGTSAAYVALDFANSQGNLNLALANSQGVVIRQSIGFADDERVSLNGLGVGTYEVRVYGYNGAKNASYSLTINPGPVKTAGNRVLYVNFDGASISRTELVRWAGTDWAAGLAQIDADNNGITVQPFFKNRADRGQIISRVMSLLAADLSPFGITVKRTTGKAVEGVGATTIFAGVASLTNGYKNASGDVDYGNDNRTDVGFVRDEWWGTVEKTALAMADVTLHEAGHSWGLYHVSSGNYLETMGIRYSAPQTLWTSNTGFLNQTFPEYLTHGGGRGPQNSYRTMAATFGLIAGPIPSGAGGFIGNVAQNVAQDDVFTADHPASAFRALELGYSTTDDLVHRTGNDCDCCCPGCRAINTLVESRPNVPVGVWRQSVDRLFVQAAQRPPSPTARPTTALTERKPDPVPGATNRPSAITTHWQPELLTWRRGPASHALPPLDILPSPSAADDLRS